MTTSDPIQEGSENEVTDTGTNEAGGEPITDPVNLFIVIPITNLSCVVIIPYVYMSEWNCYVSVVEKHVICQNFSCSIYSSRRKTGINKMTLMRT